MANTRAKTSIDGKTAGARSERPRERKATSFDSNASHRRDIKLGYLIHDVSRMRRTAFDQLMKPLGVTRAQWWVLAHLSRHDGMVQTQLADLLDVGKASLGSLLDRLEATGFIERRPDSTDRRVKRVFLSRSSMQLLEQLAAAEAAFNSQILAKLGDKDRNELIRMLSTVKDSLSQMGLIDSTSED